MESSSILVLAAVERELQPLERLLDSTTIPGVRTRLTGVGKVSSAVATERALEELRPARVLLVGCAGAFPSARLEIGDVVVASEEILADEGVETEDGFLTLRDLGLPAARRGERVVYNRIPLCAPSSALVARLQETCADGFRLATGPCATVSTGSATEVRVGELASRWDPLVESMEGAACALVCWTRGVPFQEVRGVSNPLGPRDRSTWDVDAACRNAARAAMALLEEP
ncbi:MAG: futalosine hydrolase [Planctomycetota bacterium]|nr:futalosine hydrolase [Planctomycetota bacterium]